MTMPYMNETPCQHGNYACPLCDAAWTPGQGAIDAGPERTRSHAAQDGSTGESPLTGLNSHSERNTMGPLVQVKISFAQPAADRLAWIRRQMSERKGRHVTYTEALEALMDRAGEREDQVDYSAIDQRLYDRGGVGPRHG